MEGGKEGERRERGRVGKQGWMGEGRKRRSVV